MSLSEHAESRLGITSLTEAAQRSRLPFFIWLIIVSTGFACLSSVEIGGIHLTGIAWVVPLIAAILLLSARLRSIRFPVWIWVPWALLLGISFVYSKYSGLQRTVQVIAPVIVGITMSTYKLDEEGLESFLRACKQLSIALIVIAGFKSGLFVTGVLPERTGLAAEVMTGMLLCSVFAASYSLGTSRDIIWWLALATIPFIAVTRTAIAATFLTLPLTLGPMKLKRRIIYMLIVCIIGTAIFYTPRVQKKFFYQGQGEMSDVLDMNFADTGRFFMWEQMRKGVMSEPWFGHGVGAGEDFTWKITMGSVGYPHNDWLLTEYDYGKVGVIIYAATLLAMCLHAFRLSLVTSGITRILFAAGSAGFIVFAMMMYTDNIMVYASFFGNLHFSILGLAYGSMPKAGLSRRVKYIIRW